MLDENGYSHDKDGNLDPGIAKYVIELQKLGVEIMQSCQGGAGHSYDKPTIEFDGTSHCGFIALGHAIRERWPVDSLSRVWEYDRSDSEVVAPYWKLEFHEPKED